MLLRALHLGVMLLQLAMLQLKLTRGSVKNGDIYIALILRL